VVGFLRSTVIALCFYIPISAYASNAPQPAAADVAAILRGLGFQASNIPASSFSLFDLDGNEVNLESFRGQWVLLAFWATWCGACKQEMPSLQFLHEAQKGQGLKVLGIAIDEDPLPVVSDFAASRNISFPILLDQTNRVAGDYRAQAIPALYLVSPEQRVIGVARGAINWNERRKLELVAQLVGLKEVPELPVAPAKDLAPELQPPTLALHFTEGEHLAGKTQILDVELSWPGDSHLYLIKTPKITLPPGVALGTPSSFSSSENSNSRLHFHFPLTAKAAGTYLIGPVELAYRHKDATSDSFSRLPAEELVVVDTPRLWPQIVAGLALLAMVVLGFRLMRRRSDARKAAVLKKAAAQEQREELARRYHEISRLKLMGQQREYTIALMALVGPTLSAAELEEFAKLQQEVMYSGTVLMPGKVKHYERHLERVLAEEVK
jgi:peroxiredoxin